MYSGNAGICKGCGQMVLWIRTKQGKNMPVNPEILDYKEGYGNEKIVTQNGDVRTGTTRVPHEEADGFGYISHFATCKKASTFRRK